MRGKSIDLSGMKFGRLLVVSASDIKLKKDRQHCWNCLCDCGKTKVIRGHSLRCGETKSCGCLSIETVRTRLSYGEASFNRYFSSLRKGAKNRNYEFSLSEARVKELNSKNCFYCNRPPSSGINNETQKRHNGLYVYTGIDRVDNSRGYTNDNVVPCCYLCNKAKGKLSKSEFMNLISEIYNNSFS
jgi:hypothetical protein